MNKTNNTGALTHDLYTPNLLSDADPDFDIEPTRYGYKLNIIANLPTSTQFNDSHSDEFFIYRLIELHYLAEFSQLEPAFYEATGYILPRLWTSQEEYAALTARAMHLINKADSVLNIDMLSEQTAADNLNEAERGRITPGPYETLRDVLSRYQQKLNSQKTITHKNRRSRDALISLAVRALGSKDMAVFCGEQPSLFNLSYIKTSRFEDLPLFRSYWEANYSDALGGIKSIIDDCGTAYKKTFDEWGFNALSTVKRVNAQIISTQMELYATELITREYYHCENHHLRNQMPLVDYVSVHMRRHKKNLEKNLLVLGKNKE